MIRFTKMQALGNDFVVINHVAQPIALTSAFIRRLSDRHYGVGCDQVLLLTKTDHPKADFGYRIFNADGGEVYQCGNGARCMGLFVQQEKLSNKKVIYLATRHDLMRVECVGKNEVMVDLAQPNFAPMSLPFITAENTAPYHLKLNQASIVFDVVSVGNPHCVIRVDQIVLSDVEKIGAELNAHPAFPEGVNVGFVCCDSPNAITLCVYERGAGITQACGSGACAAVAVGRWQNYLADDVVVHQAGGALRVLCQSPTDVIQLCGPAEVVFTGEFSDC